MKGHAFAAVCLTHGRREWRAKSRHERRLFLAGPLTSASDLGAAVVGEAPTYLAVECTGFARSRTGLAPGLPESAGRDADGLLDFSAALAAGVAQLRYGPREFQFAIDLTVAQAPTTDEGWGVEPYDQPPPPIESPAEESDRQGKSKVRSRWNPYLSEFKGLVRIRRFLDGPVVPSQNDGRRFAPGFYVLALTVALLGSLASALSYASGAHSVELVPVINGTSDLKHKAVFGYFWEVRHCFWTLVGVPTVILLGMCTLRMIYAVLNELQPDRLKLDTIPAIPRSAAGQSPVAVLGALNRCRYTKCGIAAGLISLVVFFAVPFNEFLTFSPHHFGYVQSVFADRWATDGEVQKTLIIKDNKFKFDPPLEESKVGSFGIRVTGGSRTAAQKGCFWVFLVLDFGVQMCFVAFATWLGSKILFFLWDTYAAIFRGLAGPQGGGSARLNSKFFDSLRDLYTAIVVRLRGVRDRVLPQRCVQRYRSHVLIELDYFDERKRYGLAPLDKVLVCAGCYSLLIFVLHFLVPFLLTKLQEPWDGINFLFPTEFQHALNLINAILALSVLPLLFILFPSAIIDDLAKQAGTEVTNELERKSKMYGGSEEIDKKLQRIDQQHMLFSLPGIPATVTTLLVKAVAFGVFLYLGFFVLLYFSGYALAKAAGP